LEIDELLVGLTIINYQTKYVKAVFVSYDIMTCVMWCSIHWFHTLIVYDITV